MKKIIKLFLAEFFLTVLLSLISCEGQLVPKSAFGVKEQSGLKHSDSHNTHNKRITLACWNVQTFFDSVTDGSEYQDFRGSDKWNKEKYQKRLNKLCEVMTAMNPDIFVMEEIENEAVVQDISNQLAGGTWDKKKSWQYACFVKEKDSSIGCAVFSRYELCNLKAHSLDIRTQKTSQPSSRPLLQVEVLAGDKSFVLFVNHWKSKSGGQEETEIWRDWQEALLSNLAEQCSGELPVVMCGDFNRSAEDFILATDSEYENVLLRGRGEFRVYNPWVGADGTFSEDCGSYYYDGCWERIDNILAAGDVQISNFQIFADPPVADDYGFPQGYKVYSDSGCSDHLPLMCVLLL